ncbi:quercetin dioxygenase-like cupin family protein [Pseudonocardia kunmingensis]|uniref:Quercetin dioxygenase-like cupin family protein n=1 Tax=Pseudonocardia kunmingensis TaxID=630975 RepID=A0A543DK77_9PSEU|nr:cupin domain-containing protein [Pseudonocardia kunmingensis]TQM09738.1 quercetin dioxygenase-like cupin family protein [Pseudonocardia kunmingensis]
MTPYRLDRGEGEALWMFDSLDVIKAGAAETGGAFTLVEFRESEGSAVPVHVNERSDTGFYVVDGEFDFVVGDERMRQTAGSWLFVPRGTGHGWRCRSAEGRALHLSVPGGRDGFYREVGEAVPAGAPLPRRQEPDVEALAATAARHGIVIVGPPPEA